MQQKTLIIILAIIIVVALSALGVYMFYPQAFKFLQTEPTAIERTKPKVIEGVPEIPKTEKIISEEGKTSEVKGEVEVAFVPKNEGEKVVVSKAILTVKGSYDLAVPEAQKWAPDAKLVFIQSAGGAITLEGKSNQWQLAFASASKKGMGYEIVVQGDQIVSKKEITSTASGANLPQNWYDSDGPIKASQSMPQFANATISSISFYYDLDSKVWMYNLSNSSGQTTGWPVR